MSKKARSAQSADPCNDRNERARAIAETMPEDRAALLEIAAEAVRDMHGAILTGQGETAEAAANRYEAAVWVLNGGTFFASMDRSKPDAGGLLAEDHCRAAPGEIPMWGQTGEFVVTVAGIRALVTVRDGFDRFRVALGFNAVDVDGPFISPTGCRSHFADVVAGHTVEDVAKGVFAAYLGKERCAVDVDARARCADRVSSRPWIGAQPRPVESERAFERAGQMDFGF